MSNNTYTFKEICQYTGYKSSVIRYYEKEFNLNIARDINGRRIFKKEDLDKLLLIKSYQDKGFTNGQIKKKILTGELISLEEIAATISSQYSPPSSLGSSNGVNRDVIKYMEEKFNEITSNISELNQTVISKERDIILSENLKLKMENKQKTYELIELKEKLRAEKEKNVGFLKRIFKKSR